MPKHIDAEADAHRRRLYDQGMNDCALASREGVRSETIARWRKVRNLASNDPHRLRKSEEAVRLLRYKLGWNDAAIARAEGRARPSIRQWRTSRGLPPNAAVGWQNNPKPREPMSAVPALIKRAVGSSLAPDIVDDVISEILLDVLGGDLPLSAVAKEARKYGNRFLDRFASKFGPQSLDEMIGPDRDVRLIDTIRDESADAWLEEMGATVW